MRPRHFWRNVGFDELSELYASMMIRGLAISLTGIFIPLYLHQQQFSIGEIIMVAAWYFTIRAIATDLLAGYTVAKIGPKHTMLIGHVLLIISTALFLTLPQQGWPVWVLGGVWGASSSFFFIPFHIDFSRVKHAEHGGKELGFINVMERIGSALGPIIGGLVATLFGPEYIFWSATVLLLISLWPLFRTAEPIKTNQKLDFKGFKVQALSRDYISVMGLGIENTLTMFLWSLLLGVFILAGSSVYAELGAISSVTFVVSIAAARVIGQVIDRKHGRKLLRTAALGNAVLHLFRPFISGFPTALGINMVNEVVTPGYRMPYFKGLYDAADSHPGYRIVYLTSMELISSIAKATAWWLLVILTQVLSGREVINVGFVLAAAASCVIMTERFKALQTSNIIKLGHGKA